jgi:hypothetical protein
LTEVKDGLALVIFAFKRVRKRDPVSGAEPMNWLGLRDWEALKCHYTQVWQQAKRVRRARITIPMKGRVEHE